ncbi:MAG: glycosyltransferase involved in cell wall biosynthesis [Flavobacteriales bacterium]|jgi:glycosyltransferase involved in cell wall biosynthesis
MAKILRILNRFNLGGPVYNAANLSAGLAPEFETLLIGGIPETDEISAVFIPENMGVQVECIPEMRRSIKFRQDYRAYQKIRQIIRTFQPDIVHTHASKAGALGRLAAFKEGVPVVVHTFHGHVFHSYFGKAKTMLFKVLERNLAKRSSAVVVISNQQRHELVNQHRIIPKEKAHVIPLGFDLNRFQTNNDQRRAAFRKKYSLPDGKVAIGIIGRLAPIKNHSLFIEVISKLDPKKYVAFIIGDGEERDSIERELKEQNLSFAEAPKYSNEQVCFTSWVTEIEFVLPGLDLVVLTSHNEGTPVSIIEAQAAGIAVVSTKVGGVQDVVLHEKTGFLVAPNDASQFANAVSQLIDSESLRKSFGARGIEHAFSLFTKERLSANMRALYQSLI